MSLLYKNEHLACYNYTSIETACFHILSLKKGDVIERQMPESSVLLYVLSGKAYITCEDLKSDVFVEGSLLLVPKNFLGYLRAEEDSKLITCICSKDLKLCSAFSIQKLKEFIPEDFCYTFKSLDVNRQIKDYFQYLVQTLSEGLGCIHFHTLKRDELFLYLRAYFGKKELAEFFAPLLSINMDFKDFVLSQYRVVKDVKDFAERANMSLSTFNRRFKESFNEPASKWLVARRAEEVRKDIVMTSMTFSEIAEKYEFSSASYLTAFCKQHHGMSPNDLREKGLEYNHKVLNDLKS